MAPYPVLNALSSSSPPPLSPLPPSHPKIPYSTTLPQNQWGPGAIGTVFFGVVMFLIGVTALWQGRRSRREDDEEEQFQSTPPAIVGARPIDEAEDPMEDLDQEFGSERVAGDIDMDERDQDKRRNEDECDRSRKEDVMKKKEENEEEEEKETEFIEIEKATRTDTEGTLVACDDEGSLDTDEKGKVELDFL